MKFPHRIVRQSEIALLHNQIAALQQEIEQATAFIKSIGTERAYSIKEKSIKKSGLIQELDLLENKLKKVAEEEKHRHWAAEGLAMFAKLLRHNGEETEVLASKVIAKIVQYINAVQGSLFVVNNEEGRPVLEMLACYAYERKKFLKKKIEIGEGLAGQVYLEKETTMLTEVPEKYLTVTSGLGEAPPRCIIIIPLIYNDVVMGILEIASFQVFPPHVTGFLEKLGENIASALSSVKITETTKKLLEETQLKTEQTRAQEEELRQNLEELQAIQEELLRKQKQIDQKSELMQLILDNIPVPTFVKDESGRYLMINKAEAMILGKPESEVIGKDDNAFTTDEAERQSVKDSDNKALNSMVPVELPFQEFTGPDNIKHIFKTTKASFLNTMTGQRNIVGVSMDVSHQLMLEQTRKAENIIQMNNVLIDLAGRQRMLSQKIGFYSEMILRGKHEHGPALEKAIGLHDSSLQVLKNGGLPPDMEAAVELAAAHPDLLPAIEEIENLWNPYKTAADLLVKASTTRKEVIKEKERAIEVIEDLGEKLLIKNNQLVTIYKKMMQKQLKEIR